ncbi:MAG TPA: sugar ABC transporter permease YjfF [Armatimonadetes bacterium]|nr:sugar ABC transporter permease YjfF [Armatimonadota bacterium]
MRRLLGPRMLPLAATGLVVVLLYLAAGAKFHDSNWFTYRVLRDLVVNNGVLGVLAIGMTFVILSGGIDLSIGSTVAFVGILSATLLGQGWSPPAVITLSLVCGVALGALMGWLVASFDLPPFMVTLGGMFLMRGVTLLINDSQIAITHPTYLASGKWPIHPAAGAWLIALVVALYLLHYTRFGRNIYAVGGSEQSALLMGLPVWRTKVAVYACCSLFAAFAGVAQSFVSLSGDSTQGVAQEMDAIAAVVIGGTLLTGGRGYVAGTVLGVLILGLIQSAIIFANINSWWTRIGIGLLLLIFVLLQRAIQQRVDRQ